VKLHVCEVCGKPLVCPSCSKRPLNAQAQAVKTCLDAYVAGREQIKQPYPGDPPAGCVIRWLGQQHDREAAVRTFEVSVMVAVNAHNLDSQYHPFPKTVPKFIDAIPKLDKSWMDSARANSAKRRGEILSAPTVEVTPAQRATADSERKRIARQTDCAAELRFHQRNWDECGTKPECRDCPQRETPGRERYSPGPARHGERQDGRLKPIITSEET